MAGGAQAPGAAAVINLHNLAGLWGLGAAMSGPTGVEAGRHGARRAASAFGAKQACGMLSAWRCQAGNHRTEWPDSSAGWQG